MAHKFKDTLRQPKDSTPADKWAFIVLPKAVSDTLPRRGRTTVEATVNSETFTVTLEPDGQLSHWLRIDGDILEAIGADFGDTVTVDITAVESEPEPSVPDDLQQALASVPKANAVWLDTTAIARLDWIHWVESAKQTKTRTKRINDACEMLAAGKRRVCCFDTSGFYSKALKPPADAI